jgi:hypothetical protein
VRLVSPWAAEAVKVLHCWLFAATLAVAWAYARVTFTELAKGARQGGLRGFWSDPRFAVGRSMLWSWVVATGMVWGYVPVMAAYWLSGAEPVATPGVPAWAMIVGLAWAHLGFVGRWAEYRPDRVGWRLFRAYALAACLAGLVAALLPPG